MIEGICALLDLARRQIFDPAREPPDVAEAIAYLPVALAPGEVGHRDFDCHSTLDRPRECFFEWCVWIGYAVFNLAFLPWGVFALAGQAIILGSIFGVTGIPPTDKQALRSRGDAYRSYQRRVSRFLPRLPKRPPA